VYVGERLYAEKLARIYRATAEDETAAFEYLQKYRDTEFSAVDCLSFVVMDKHGISEALTFDETHT
jgi:predicted nucleic acid-binding protein